MQNINNYDDDNYENDYEDTIYECDEISATKYNIILCELYNDKIHGGTNDQANNHYLVINRIKKLNMDFINCLTHVIKQDYIHQQQNITPHKFIKNYQNMITNANYIKPEIGEILHLQSGHTVCIIKTFWLKIIQRAWKKVYNIRLQMIKMRCNIQSLKHREITGLWPQNCRRLPSLHGILLS